ncbi:MAG: dephospho-CoA kinase [Bacteroidota bacterium]|nr:dephospho-CoA kinase [Bacteroidota bacterium]
MMTRIGITGGIGGGKSSVSEILRNKGVTVFSADEIANTFTEHDETIRRKIIQTFGAEAYNSTTRAFERSYIARIVFSDKKKLDALNAIVHPAVLRGIEQQCKEIERRASTPYVGIEAALVFESGLNKKLDYVLGIVADDAIRIERVMKRNGFPEDETRRRIATQLPTEQLIEKSDFILYNNETKDILRSNVEFFHSLFLTLPSKRKQ